MSQHNLHEKTAHVVKAQRKAFTLLKFKPVEQGTARPDAVVSSTCSVNLKLDLKNYALLLN